MKRSTRFIAALLASSAIGSPALANLPAPRFVNVDSNGVDLTTGKVEFAFEEGGIGSGEGAVRMQRIFAQDAGWVDNYSGGLFDETVGGTTKTYVQIAGISDVFTNLGGTYTSDNAAGSTLARDSLTGFWNYTSADGTKIAFLDTGYFNYDFSCPGANPQTCRLPLSITKPNGLKISFAWETGALCYNIPNEPCSTEKDYDRLTSITTSAGYSATITYVSSSIGVWPTPNPNWFKRSAITFNNSANPPSPAPTVTYGYPSSGVTTVTNPGGRQSTLTTDSSGRIIGVRRPGSSSDDISYAYGTDGTISSAIKDGVTTTYARSISGSTVSETTTDPLSGHTITASDQTIGRPTSFQDELGHTTSYQYDANGRLTQATRPEGNYVQYSYDPRGNVTTATNFAKAGSGLANIITSASFDMSCGNVVKCNKANSTTDAKGNVTDYTYDATHGGVLTVTRPAPSAGAVRPQTRLSYSPITSASGDPVFEPTGTSACRTTSSCSGGTDETKATAVYSSNLLQTSVTRGDGTGALAATTAVNYDPIGNVTYVDGPLPDTGDTTRYLYNQNREIVGKIDPDPDGAGPLKNRAVRVTYGSTGLVTKQEFGTTSSQIDAAWAAFSPAQTVDIGYDANRRPITSKLSASGTDYALTQASYDALGRTDCTAVRMNTSIYGSLPTSACTLGATGSKGPDQISQMVYDAASEPTQLKEAVGTADAATERTIAYTPNGIAATLTDGENNRTDTYHDGFDRLGVIFYPSATKGSATTNYNDKEQFAYDANGNVTADSTRNAEVLQYSYDNLNRPTVKVVPDRAGWNTTYSTGDVYYGYDNLGRVISARFDSTSGEGVTNSFDALGRLTASTTTLMGVSRTFNSTYDAGGNRTSLTGHAGYNAGFSFDQLGRMTYYNEGQTTPTVNIGYDDLGRRVFMNRLASSTTYQYDGISRLTTLNQNFAGGVNNSVQTFAYSPASQIQSQTRNNDAFAFTGNYNVNRPYTSNGLNQYTAAGSASFTYDANGNLAGDGTKAYAYDVENRLVYVPGSPAASLWYDPLGRLYKVNTASTATVFAYDGVDPSPIREYDGSSGATLHSYVRGPGTDEVLVDYQDSPSWARRFPHADERGSIVALADSSGNASNINTYDEYGIPGSANTGRFQYTGQLWVPEIGMQYSKARMYSPTLGRFMQTDPIGYADGANWYAYTHNDPVNGMDPSGLSTPAPIPDRLAVMPINPGECTSTATTITVCGQRDPNAPSESATLLALVLDRPGPVPSTNEGSDRPQKDNSIPHCAAVAAYAHKGQIAVDALSAVPAGKVAALAGRTLSATTRFAISAGQLHGAFGSALLSAVNGDGNGAGLAAAGYGAVVADAAEVGGSFIPGVGALIAAASIANDVFRSREYKACREAK